MMRTTRSASALIVIALLGSAQGVPTDQNATWEEIRADRSLNVRAPSVQFDGVFVPVFDLCTQDGQIRAIHPDFAVCKDPALGEAVCDTMTVHLSRPLLGQGYVCTDPMGHDGTCDVSGADRVTVTIPTHYEVPVHAMNPSDPTGGAPLFTKPFDVPACDASGTEAPST
jgi:hypothetical protein